ncbi:MAG: hypothetical protein AAB623_00840 [Patescibacteria group bacterium]
MKEGIPEKKIFPPYEDPDVTEKKFTAMKSLLEGKLDIVSSEHRPTSIDFQGLRPDSTEEDFLQWIKKEMGIKPEIILENGNSQESAKKYHLLNYAYQAAKNFLRDTLKYPEAELFIEVQSISSKKDIFDILKRVKLVADKGGLSKSIKYCRLVKTTIATYEALKNDSKLLKKITEDFEGALVSSPSENGASTDTPFVFSGEYNAVGKRFRAIDDSNLEGIINSRPKDFEKLILRFLSRPESDAKTALKDGIASRITIDKNQAIKLLPILYEWLTKKMKAMDIKIENKSFFSTQQIKKFSENLKALLSNEKPNPLSGGKFEALFIIGKLHSSSHGGQFEIQLVDLDNKNEEGEMHHDKYDVVKLITARTRLDGGCPESVFEKFISDAHVKSGISLKEIKYDLIEKPGAPIVKKRKKNGTYIYIADSVYQRWHEFKWVDESLYEEIQDAHK